MRIHRTKNINVEMGSALNPAIFSMKCAEIKNIFWTGNRLDSVKDVATNLLWYMEYDAQGRLVHEYTRSGSIDNTYEYDCTTTGDRITTFHTHTLVESETIFTETTAEYDIEYLD